MDSFLNWLVGEAGAGWIIGLLGIVGAIYTWFQRERYPLVFVQEIRRTRLLDIHPSQLTHVSVSYRDSEGIVIPITKLEQSEIVIYNSGSLDLLKPIKFTLKINIDEDAPKQMTTPQTNNIFWKFVVDDKKSICESSHEGVVITIPYLNSYHVHQHYVSAYLISDCKVRFTLTERMGEGWSARTLSLNEYKTYVGRVSRIMRGLSLLAIFLALFSSLTNPLILPWINPNQENIETVLRLYRQLFESRREYGLTTALLQFSGTYGFWLPISLVFFALLYVAALWFQEFVGFLFKYRYGALPPTQFEFLQASTIQKFWGAFRKSF